MKKLIYALSFIFALSSLFIISGCTEPEVIVADDIEVTSITVSGAGNLAVITTLGGTLQMSALIGPTNATDDSVVWTVLAGTGTATISTTGILTATTNGTVTVYATSVSNNSISGMKVITLSNQTVADVAVTSITVSGDGNLAVITTLGGTLQMSALVAPTNATNSSVVWTVLNGTGTATISTTGLLTATTNGTVTVKATSVSNSGINGTKDVTLTNQTVADIAVTSITVLGALDAVIIDTLGGTLQMSTLIEPTNATDNSVVWTVLDGTGTATINTTGLLTALTDGTVTVTATSVSNTGVSGTKVITLSNQVVADVAVLAITVSGALDVAYIDTLAGTLQMSALIEPTDATDDSVVWTVLDGTGTATISTTGLLSALTNGTVTVYATSVSNNGISGFYEVTITNQGTADSNATLTNLTTDGITVMGFTTLHNDYVMVLANGSTVTPVTIATKYQESATVVITPATDVTSEFSADRTTTVVVTSEDTLSVKTYTILFEPSIIAVDLASADDFVLLAQTGISTATTSAITGNIGINPAASTYITGFSLTIDPSGLFSTSSQVTGNIYASDYITLTPSNLITAVADMLIAYGDAAGRTANYNELYAGDLTGKTLTPGVYKFSNSVLINADLTLTGNENDVWIFQIAGSLTQASNVSITLAGGALAKNIIWQVADTVSISTGAHFEGTILAMTNIVVQTNASVNGTLLAQTAITLDANIIVKPVSA